MSFWKKLAIEKKPFFCAAPMADVTDAAFRRMLATYGRPDVLWTEFVSADGLMSPGREVLLKDLVYAEEERPIVAQLFSSRPEAMEGAARLCAELGFDGIDINMGCPDRAVERQGAGAAMIRTPEVAGEVIAAAKRGAGGLPVSVKTRVGYGSVAIEEWLGFLLRQELSALTVHARTRKEMSKVPAVWDRVRMAVELRDRLGVDTLIIGNGDVVSLLDGRARARESGCDGVMVGRALLGNPWFFDDSREILAALPKKHPLRGLPWLGRFFETRRRAPESARRPLSIPERLRALEEHTALFEKLLGGVKSFAVMKKQFKAYCTGFPGSKELRMALMEATSAREVSQIVENFLHTTTL